jgi:putative oxidoreductase
MNKAVVVCRILMGVPIAVFGCNWFLKFMPRVVDTSRDESGFTKKAYDLLVAFADSGFVMETIVLVHVAAGVMLVANRFVPLALAIHLPVTLMMVLFHARLDSATGMIAFPLAGLHLFLIYAYQDSFRPLLAPKPESLWGHSSGQPASQS